MYHRHCSSHISAIWGAGSSVSQMPSAAAFLAITSLIVDHGSRITDHRGV
jgi:hypothetical protein